MQTQLDVSCTLSSSQTIDVAPHNCNGSPTFFIATNFMDDLEAGVDMATHSCQTEE